MNDRDLVHHGLVIKRHASAAAVAQLTGLAVARVEQVLADSVAGRRVAAVNGAYVLTPLARVALEGRYGLHFASLRGQADFRAAFDAFERINRTLKQVITEWQTITIAGASVPNDHSDEAHDAAIIDRLGAIQEQLEPVLARLARHVPRLAIYGNKLLAALEAAEDGDVGWVSDIRKESYHTVWFELHEDLLRLAGRIREE